MLPTEGSLREIGGPYPTLPFGKAQSPTRVILGLIAVGSCIFASTLVQSYANTIFV